MSATMSATLSATLSTSMSATMSNSMSAIFFVSHLVHLHVGHHVSCHFGHHNIVSTIYDVSETQTEWKSESITNIWTDLPTYGLTGVGARGLYFEVKRNRLLDS